MNKTIMKGGNPQQQRHLHLQSHPQSAPFNGMHFGLPPPPTQNGFAYDKNNNQSLLMENLDLINSVVQQMPPSSPTNSTTSSMSTSSSSCSSSSNNNNNQLHPFMLKQLINQQQQAMHNTLQRTISHPMHSMSQQHAQMSFTSSLMDNLQQQQQQNLNGCGDAQPSAVAAALAQHRKLERTQSEPLPQQQQLVNTSR